MKTGWEIVHGRFGPRMVLLGPWSQDAAAAFAAQGVTELELNYAKGWEGDYSFLRRHPELEVVEIIDRTTEDVTAVNDLPSLRRLKVFTYCRTSLEFRRWPKLQECSIEWRPEAQSLAECTQLESIFINRWNGGEDLRSFSAMSKLVQLRLKGPSRLRSLDGIEGNNRLQELEIALATRLSNIQALEGMRSLRRLSFDTCKKIGDLQVVATLEGLEDLIFGNCGEIESLAPLRGLESLRRVVFYESTKIKDGDLSPLESLPALESVAFQNRRHYSHRDSDFATS